MCSSQLYQARGNYLYLLGDRFSYTNRALNIEKDEGVKIWKPQIVSRIVVDLLRIYIQFKNGSQSDTKRDFKKLSEIQTFVGFGFAKSQVNANSLLFRSNK